MRIGIDCRTLQEPQPTGVSVYAQELLEALFQLPETSNVEFVLFFNAHQLRGNRKGDLAQRVDQVRSRFEQVRAQSGGSPLEFRERHWPGKLVKFTQVLWGSPSVKWMFGTVDAVFLPTWQFFPFQNAHRGGVPYMLTVHDVGFERYPECWTARQRWWHKLLQPRALAQHASHLIAVSRSTQYDLTDLYAIPEQRISVVHSGLRARLLASQAVPNQSLPQEYFLSICTIEPRKNIDTLLEAFNQVHAEYPQVQLIVAGGPGWKSKHVLERMQHQDGVRYVGYISDEEKAELLAGARGFVYPSLYEGFGFPPLEAQQYGVPVIVGAHSSLPEVLGDSALYADVLDVNSLARAMKHLLTDTAVRSELIAAGNKNVERFNWNTAAQQVLNVLSELVQKQ